MMDFLRSLNLVSLFSPAFYPAFQLQDSTRGKKTHTLGKTEKTSKARERQNLQRERSFIHWLIPHVAAMPRARPNWSQKPGTISGSPMWAQEHPLLLSLATSRGWDGKWTSCDRNWHGISRLWRGGPGSWASALAQRNAIFNPFVTIETKG